eukprot:CAMPEP_0196699230 /NCGR_PEP_ID=MMETSP1090-20130531/46493_1 /TAXON_ID=37098 /ORGANISM="Isochrysis sp, Strain CCMP1244" /LENGTH=228 /DNA_ID=CAMNT_0042038915 /DNA_START=207 /DNA_END=890 /DNA_ORIENTATION=-
MSCQLSERAERENECVETEAKVTAEDDPPALIPHPPVPVHVARLVPEHIVPGGAAHLWVLPLCAAPEGGPREESALGLLPLARRQLLVQVGRHLAEEERCGRPRGELCAERQQARLVQAARRARQSDGRAQLGRQARVLQEGVLAQGDQPPVAAVVPHEHLEVEDEVGRAGRDREGGVRPRDRAVDLPPEPVEPARERGQDEDAAELLREHPGGAQLRQLLVHHHHVG